MQCPTCQNEARKFGKDRDGNQRFQCQECRKTFSDRPAKPLPEMHIALDKALLVLQLLTEGNSIRSTSRISGVAKGTVLSLLVYVGQGCEDFLTERLQHIPASNVQVDEIWGFVGMKEKAKQHRQIENDELGDAYCFVGIERDTKLIMSWHLGKRDAANTRAFMHDVKRSTRGRFQLSTDGFRPYPEAVAIVFGEDMDHATVIKDYAKIEDERRYSPSDVVGLVKRAANGNPDLNEACTSHIERQNLQIRMRNRRMTRLTNAFSKKWENHQASLAMHFACYNFVTPHGTLTKNADGCKTTPAMASGLTDHPWTLLELLTELAKSTQR